MEPPWDSEYEIIAPDFTQLVMQVRTIEHRLDHNACGAGFPEQFDDPIAAKIARFRDNDGEPQSRKVSLEPVFGQQWVDRNDTGVARNGRKQGGDAVRPILDHDADAASLAQAKRVEQRADRMRARGPAAARTSSRTGSGRQARREVSLMAGFASLLAVGSMSGCVAALG